MIINTNDSVYPDLNFNDDLSIGTYTLQCSNTILHTRQSYYDANLDSESLGDIQVSRQLEDFESQSTYSISGDVLPIQPLSSRASDKGNDGSNILRSAQTIVWVLDRKSVV